MMPTSWWVVASTAAMVIRMSTGSLSSWLKISSIETAKENERGVVDIETLTQTQNDLIDTLKQTLQIQQDGRLKRQNAEKQLVQMEGELKQQLLNYTHGSMNEQNPKDVTPH